MSPLCLGARGSLRVTMMPQSAKCAPEVQIFWPLMTQSVAVLHRARAEAGEIRARGGLGEELAPDLLAGQGLRRVALLLRLRRVGM